MSVESALVCEPVVSQYFHASFVAIVLFSPLFFYFYHSKLILKRFLYVDGYAPPFKYKYGAEYLIDPVETFNFGFGLAFQLAVAFLLLFRNERCPGVHDSVSDMDVYWKFVFWVLTPFIKNCVSIWYLRKYTKWLEGCLRDDPVTTMYAIWNYHNFDLLKTGCYISDINLYWPENVPKFTDLVLQQPRDKWMVGRGGRAELVQIFRRNKKRLDLARLAKEASEELRSAIQDLLESGAIELESPTIFQS